MRPPRTLRISREVAEYIQGLVLGGCSPEDIGRSVDRMYDRTKYRYFMVPKKEGKGFEFLPADYEMDGVAYIDAALRRLGGYLPVFFGWARFRDSWHRVAGKGRWCYNPDHPMIKVISGKAIQEPVPERRA